jgi:hypothetical protein
VAPLGIKILSFENSQLNYTYSNNYPIKISNKIAYEVLKKIISTKKTPPNLV